jgi:hypothetical protein
VKRSRFFCENCHKEVRPNAKVCPHCGRFFTAVRCPMCSYVGSARDFTHGCPNCGYAGAAADKDVGFETLDYRQDVAPARERNRTPQWVWPLAIVILILVFGGLVLIYLNF